MKLCTKCKRDKSDNEFTPRGNSLHSWCNECRRKHCKDHYRKNKKHYRQRNARRRKERKDKLIQFICEYLLEHPCIDCGEHDIRVLEFDHIDPTTKSFEIARFIRGSNQNKDLLLEEISKCVVRCANCHRRRTSSEKSDVRHRFYLERQSK